MQRRFAVLRSEIRRELENVRRLATEAEEWQDKLGDWPDVIRVRTAGGILHDFYTGTERIFRLIALRVDEDLPDAPDWHIQLLQRMATAIEGIRPAVLQLETVRQLDEYLRFRHLFRNIYGFDLEWERCQELLVELPRTFTRLERDVEAFAGFLQTLEESI